MEFACLPSEIIGQLLLIIAIIADWVMPFCALIVGKIYGSDIAYWKH